MHKYEFINSIESKLSEIDIKQYIYRSNILAVKGPNKLKL